MNHKVKKTKIYMFGFLTRLLVGAGCFLYGGLALFVLIFKKFEFEILLFSLVFISLGILFIYVDKSKYILFDYEKNIIEFHFKSYNQKNYVHALNIVSDIDVELYDKYNNKITFTLMLKGGNTQKIDFSVHYKEVFRLKRNIKRIRRSVKEAIKNN